MIDIKALMELHDIPERVARGITPFLWLKQLKKDEILVQPGDICTKGYLVVKGGLILSYLNQNDNEEKVVNFFLPSVQAYCAVWDSYFGGNKSQGKLFSIANTTVLCVNKSDLENKVTTDPEILNYYLHKLNETLILENNIRIKLITSTSEQFYQFLMTDHPDIIKYIPTKYIAQFMGISREWLSKIKSNKDY